MLAIDNQTAPLKHHQGQANDKVALQLKLTFRRTGGFAPLPIGCVIDTAAGGAEALECERLVATSGIAKTVSAKVKGACDVHYFHIEIDHDGTLQVFDFDQISLPSSVRPLVQFLIEMSTEALQD